ncbi:LysR family transcriptional regulator [Sediminibacillus dalangtanensis]|uniref:LysR family transcriptional regulator n=1 Tax=Sediminibacillus dalangtanensis TaxID=2729421 RepID=A0ABX7VW30_9BACI|nr:LysR family transcriptional regulator [Sediminibacillus dalangtanensis]QTN00759.1 LysR family transcriptional regulator [Sediminibacillus dalangtanensis]
MNIESLRMFCRVVDEGSISQAARSSYVTQPAVTRQIRQLENRYGTLLFDRTDGKLLLSDAGKTLYGYAKEIVELDNISYEAMQELIGVQASVLKVGASLTIGEYLLPGLLGNFKKQHEEIKFSLSIGNTPYILAKLEENEVDIALVESTVDNDNFKVRKFADDELILVTAHNHRWATRDYIDVQELVEEKMIWREKDSGTRLIVENALDDRGVLEGIQHAMELGSMQSIKSAVEADLGVSILPRLTVTKELKYKALREVTVKDFSIMRDLWIVQKQRRFKKSAETDFEEFLLY